MRLGLLTAFLLCILDTLSAQAVFQESEESLNNDLGYGAVQSYDEGYIIAGSSGSSSGFYMVKQDMFGAVQWTKSIAPLDSNGTPSGTNELFCVNKTKEGGYIFGGYTDGVTGGEWAALVKTDFNGNVQWFQTYGGPNGDSYTYQAQQTFDGGYIAGGETIAFGAGNIDFYLVKTDLNGNVQWSKTFGGMFMDEGYSAIQTADSDYVMTGYTQSFSANSDVYLLKADGNGNLLWSKTFGGAGTDEGHCVTELRNGDLLITGTTSSFSSGTTQLYLIRTDANGNMLWSKTYNTSPTSHEAGYSLQETADNGFIISGTTDNGFGNSDSYLLKTDSAGIVQWSRYFGNFGYERNTLVMQAYDHGYFLCGSTTSANSTNNWATYEVKTDTNGYVPCHSNGITTLENNVTSASTSPSTTAMSVPTQILSAPLMVIDSSFNLTSWCTSETGISESSDMTGGNVFPDPFSDHITIQFTQKKPERIRISIYDVNGNLVITPQAESAAPGNFQLSLSTTDLPPGMYMLRAESEDGNVLFAKHVVKFQ